MSISYKNRLKAACEQLAKGYCPRYYFSVNSDYCDMDSVWDCCVTRGERKDWKCWWDYFKRGGVI